MVRDSEFKQERILITVKTAPQPKASKSLPEVVCTAGFRENGDFVRLYPIDYRHLEQNQKYEKYQWISCKLRKHPHDPRPETFEPIMSSIELQEKIGPQHGSWKTRLSYIKLNDLPTTCWLQKKLIEQNYTISLGIVKPKVIHSFKIVRDDNLWSAGVLKAVSNGDLFGYRLPLEKIPYKFVYHYTCEEHDCSGHKMSIIDWETYRLFHKFSMESEETSISKVREKYEKEYMSDRYELYFYLGTASMHKSWMILGLIAPLKGKFNRDQVTLF